MLITFKAYQRIYVALYEIILAISRIEAYLQLEITLKECIYSVNNLKTKDQCRLKDET